MILVLKFISLPFALPPSSSTLGKVLFSMTGELVKFGAVMLVVMSGFAMSFLSLYRPNLTFGKVMCKRCSPHVASGYVSFAVFLLVLFRK